MMDTDIDTSGLAFIQGGSFGKDSRESRKKRDRESTRTNKERERARARAKKETKDKPVNFRTTKAMHALMMAWAKAQNMSFADLIETAVSEYAEREGLAKGDGRG